MNGLRWVTWWPSMILAGWIGVSYILGKPSRTATPSFRAAKDLAPMDVWGYLFLAGAVAILITSLIGRPMLVAIALAVGGVIYCWWASLFLVTVIVDEHASLVAPVLYYFIAVMHFLGARQMISASNASA